MGPAKEVHRLPKPRCPVYSKHSVDMLRVIDGAHLHLERWRASRPKEPVRSTLDGLVGTRHDLETVVLGANREG